ncbi:MAG: hypothetical protein WDN28_28555 [Chthoniobacter sp.]
MIKFLSLGAVPLLAAFVYGQRDPEPMVPTFHRVEEADRIFLANLDDQEAAQRESALQADREAAAQLQSSRPVPVAVAVPAATPSPVRATLPTARATVASIPPVAVRASIQPAAGLETATGIDSLSRNEAQSATGIGEPEVRRAIRWRHIALPSSFIRGRYLPSQHGAVAEAAYGGNAGFRQRFVTRVPQCMASVAAPSLFLLIPGGR